jgi:hypothetical protein
MQHHSPTGDQTYFQFKREGKIMQGCDRQHGTSVFKITITKHHIGHSRLSHGVLKSFVFVVLVYANGPQVALVDTFELFLNTFSF